MSYYYSDDPPAVLPPPRPLTEKEILTIATARRLLKVVDYGLQSGVGVGRPGRMCVEAAVCYAIGLNPIDDDPKCVADVVRAAKIALNDRDWPSAQARAKGLRQLAVAQLGSKGKVDSAEFATAVITRTREAIKSKKLVLEDEAQTKMAYPFLFDDSVWSRHKVYTTRHRNYGLSGPGFFEEKTRFGAHEVVTAACAICLKGDKPHGTLRPRHLYLTTIAGILLDALRDVGAPGIKLLDRVMREEAKSKEERKAARTKKAKSKTKK